MVDENGNEIFSDKIGLLIARNLSTEYKNSKFIVDVKSTGLFKTDEVYLKKTLVKQFIGKQGTFIY